MVVPRHPPEYVLTKNTVKTLMNHFRNAIIEMTFTTQTLIDRIVDEKVGKL